LTWSIENTWILEEGAALVTSQSNVQLDLGHL
jgi:hypothetical protein